MAAKRTPHSDLYVGMTMTDEEILNFINKHYHKLTDDDRIDLGLWLDHGEFSEYFKEGD